MEFGLSNYAQLSLNAPNMSNDNAEFYLETLTGTDRNFTGQLSSSSTRRCSLTPRELDRFFVYKIYKTLTSLVDNMLPLLLVSTGII